MLFVQVILLAREGGDVGRSAPWKGQLDGRRPEGAAPCQVQIQRRTRFLMYCLRAASDYGTFLATESENYHSSNR